MKDSLGRYLTTALFKELNNSPEYPPVYTLADDDGDLPSAYKIYIKADTEYEAAQQITGNWNHWQKLLRCKPFMEYLEVWRKEKEEQIVAKALKALIKVGTVPDKKGNINVVAARYLANKEWKTISKKEAERINQKLHDKLNDQSLLSELDFELNRLSDKVM